MTLTSENKKDRPKSNFQTSSLLFLCEFFKVLKKSIDVNLYLILLDMLNTYLSDAIFAINFISRFHNPKQHQTIDYKIFNPVLDLKIVTLRENRAMKNFAIKLVWFTTAYVFVFAGLNQTNLDLRIIMCLHSVGLILIPYMTYIVLTDNYKTNKTFKDWYEDHPMKTLDEEDN